MIIAPLWQCWPSSTGEVGFKGQRGRPGAQLGSWSPGEQEEQLVEVKGEFLFDFFLKGW